MAGNLEWFLMQLTCFSFFNVCRDIKVENFLLDEDMNLKVIGECMFYDQ